MFFRPTHICGMLEGYDGSDDLRFVDPWVSEYSRDIGLRPTTREQTNEPATDVFKLFDHLEDEDRGIATPQAHEDLQHKQVRFDLNASPAPLRKVHLRSSFNDTNVNPDRRVASNNNSGYCVANDGLGTDGLGTDGLGTNALGTDGLGTNALGTDGLGTYSQIDDHGDQDDFTTPPELPATISGLDDLTASIDSQRNARLASINGGYLSALDAEQIFKVYV
jgi:hypothetical protein